MLQTITYHFRQWDYRLFGAILLFLSLPNLYNLYRVSLIGNEIPDTGSLAIVAQWQFVGLIVEVFQEATVLAVFFFLGSQIRSGSAIQLDRAKSVMSFILGASFLFAVAVFLFRGAFVELIDTPEEIRTQTSAFLAINVFSIPFTLLSAAIVVLFQALGMRRVVFALAILNVLLLFILDSLLFGGHNFSLNAGVVGVGWSTLLSSAILFAVGVGLLLGSRRIPSGYLTTLPSFADMRQYFRVGFGSGVDSAVRNAAYFIMIIRLVNTIGTTEISGYYVAIQILWSFMLVPILAFADSSKALVAQESANPERVRVIWRSSMLITSVMMLVWIALTPWLSTFASALSDDSDIVQAAVTAFAILFVPYIMFCFNTVTDAVFYGLGKTQYMAYQSILTNGTVYVIAFLLYVTNIWDVTYVGIMVLFALGIVVDTVLTLWFLWRVLSADGGRPLAVGPLRHA